MRFRPISVLAIWTSFLIPQLIRRPGSGGRISRPTASYRQDHHETLDRFGPKTAALARERLGRHNGPKQKCLGPLVFKVLDAGPRTDLAALRPQRSLKLDLGADLL